MVMGFTGLGIRNDCDFGGQKNFTRPDQSSTCKVMSTEAEEYLLLTVNRLRLEDVEEFVHEAVTVVCRVYEFVKLSCL
jgi:hypothetical protein